MIASAFSRMKHELCAEAPVIEMDTLKKAAVISSKPNLRSAVRTVLPALTLVVVACGGDAGRGDEGARVVDAALTQATTRCVAEETGITVPDGFCATVFADSLGHARHIAVAPNGDVYVNTRSGSNDEGSPPAGGFLVGLRDTNGDGHADLRERFGDSASRQGTGGTGIGIYNGRLFVEADAYILRYDIPAGGLGLTGVPDTVVSGLPLTGDHPMHAFAIDPSGTLYVASGSATNACQVKNRTLESPGVDPCTELNTRGGVWRYAADSTGQRFSAAERYATGIRNAEGMTIGPDGALWTTQHGRDELAGNWPDRYSAEQSQELPAEEFMRVTEGDDFGWPYCYWDGRSQKARVLAPEYGGDGNEVGRCASKKAPVATFPAHWAPNGAVFYTGTQFPEHYRGGVFIAFHGSWNRAPAPQGGYNVTFQPMANDATAGPYEVFATGFPGGTVNPAQATYRPSGVTVGADGALYVTDDQKGRVWRITYNGSGVP